MLREPEGSPSKFYVMRKKLEYGRDEVALLCLIAISVVVMWLRHLGASYWVDETLTVWVSSGELSEVVTRSFRYQGQSPLYFVLIAAWIELFGSSEIAVRFPSVLCVSFALYLFYQFAGSYWDRRYALIAVFLLAVSQAAVFSAANARPYGLALLFCVLSWLFWTRYLKRGLRFDFSVSLFAACGAFYAHYLTAPLVLFHLFSGSRQTLLPQRLLFVTLCLLLSLPALPHLLALQIQSHTLSLDGSPSVLELLLSLLQPGLLLLILLSTALYDGLIRRAKPRAAPKSFPKLLFIFLFVAPTVCLFLLALFFQSATLFKEFYLFWRMPFFVLVVASFLRMRSFVATFLLAIFLFAAEPYRAVPTENWRGLIRYLESEMGGGQESGEIVLVYSGLFESQNQRFFSGEGKEYLSAPFVVYGFKSAVVPVPLNPFREDFKDYLSDVVEEYVEHGESFWLAGSSSVRLEGIRPENFLRDSLKQLGLVQISQRSFSGLWLHEYRRKSIELCPVSQLEPKEAG